MAIFVATEICISEVIVISEAGMLRRSRLNNRTCRCCLWRALTHKTEHWLKSRCAKTQSCLLLFRRLFLLVVSCSFSLSWLVWELWFAVHSLGLLFLNKLSNFLLFGHALHCNLFLFFGFWLFNLLNLNRWGLSRFNLHLFFNSWLNFLCLGLLDGCLGGIKLIELRRSEWSSF